VEEPLEVRAAQEAVEGSAVQMIRSEMGDPVERRREQSPDQHRSRKIKKDLPERFQNRRTMYWQCTPLSKLLWGSSIP